MSVLKLIVVSGLPGSGKSTLAEGIARALRMPLLSVDPIESAMIQSGLERSFQTGLAAYFVAERLASEQLQGDLSVIIDAVSPVEEARELWRGLSKKFHASLIIIECVLDREVHRHRIESRIRNLHGIPEVTWNDVEQRRQEYIPRNEERLIINSANNVETNLEKALEYIVTLKTKPSPLLEVAAQR